MEYVSHDARTSALRGVWGGWGEVPRESLMGRCAQRTRSAQIELSLRAHLGASRSVASGINPGDSAAYRLGSAVCPSSAARALVEGRGLHRATGTRDKGSRWTYIGTCRVQSHPKRASREGLASHRHFVEEEPSCRRVRTRPTLRAGPCRRPQNARAPEEGALASSAMQPPKSRALFLAARSQCWCGRLLNPALA